MAMTMRRQMVTDRVGRALRRSIPLLAFWLAALPFAQAAPPSLDLGPVREGADFEYCRFKVVGSSGQQCQPPLLPDEVICLPCDLTHGGQGGCVGAGTRATVPLVSPDARQEICKVSVQSLGGQCGACGTGVRTFSNDPTDIGTFTIDQREAEEGEEFCVYSVADIKIPKDSDQQERRQNCAVHMNQKVCLPCPVGGACHVAGWKTKASLNIRDDRKDCPVILESKGAACAECPDKGVLFTAP